MNLNKENKEQPPPEGLKFIDVGTFNETSLDKEGFDVNTINHSDNDISLPQEENNIREPNFQPKDSIQ